MKRAASSQEIADDGIDPEDFGIPDDVWLTGIAPHLDNESLYRLSDTHPFFRKALAPRLPDIRWGMQATQQEQYVQSRTRQITRELFSILGEIAAPGVAEVTVKLRNGEQSVDRFFKDTMAISLRIGTNQVPDQGKVRFVKDVMALLGLPDWVRDSVFWGPWAVRERNAFISGGHLSSRLDHQWYDWLMQACQGEAGILADIIEAHPAGWYLFLAPGNLVLEILRGSVFRLITLISGNRGRLSAPAAARFDAVVGELRFIMAHVQPPSSTYPWLVERAWEITRDPRMYERYPIRASPRYTNPQKIAYGPTAEPLSLIQGMEALQVEPDWRTNARMKLRSSSEPLPRGYDEASIEMRLVPYWRDPYR